MKSQFRHVALIGKYQAQGSRSALEDIAHFLGTQGCEVALEQDTANNTGLSHFPTLDAAGIGAHCALALVVGGDGTMLGIGRLLAEFGVPMVGINRGGSASSPTSPSKTIKIRWSRCCAVNSRKTDAP